MKEKKFQTFTYSDQSMSLGNSHTKKSKEKVLIREIHSKETDRK